MQIYVIYEYTFTIIFVYMHAHFIDQYENAKPSLHQKVITQHNGNKREDKLSLKLGSKYPFNE